MGNTPKLRFEGFTGDWVQQKLGGVFTQTANYVNPKQDNIELWSLTVEDGLTRKTERYERQFLVRKDDKFKEVQPGDIVYNPMNMTLGAVGYNGTGKSVAVSGYYTTMIANDGYDSYFINTWLKSPQAIQLYKSHATGTLLEKQRVQFPTLSAIPSSFPFSKEQAEIGMLFRELDALIDLSFRKLYALKKAKQFYLQTMFPQNGERVPKLRFAGFEGDWEQRRFAELYAKSNEKNDGTFNGDRIISVANMRFKPDEVTSDDDYMRTYNIMRLGDIAFEGNKSKKFAHGRFVENTIGDGIVSHVFDVFRPITEYDLLFWKKMINNEGVMGRIMARCTKASTMMTNLVASDFLNETIAVPSLDEQKQIGIFLNGLDEFITYQKHKVDALKTMKQIMLQNMFV